MRVLAADDNPMSRRVLEISLSKWGYEAKVVDGGEAAAAALLDPGGPRLALLDWMMPGVDGLEVCRRIRGAVGLPHRYIVMLTSRGEKRDIVEALRAGADDYVVKPFTPDELHARLEVGRRMIELQQALEESNRRLAETARTDHLTRVLNRSALMDELETERNRAAREGRPMAVLMIDIDHFKAVNDSRGHLAGDEVLRGVAGRLRGACRPYDVVGRFGGEEFTILAPGIPREALRGMAERCRARVGAAPFEHEGERIRVTVSVGAVWLEGREACRTEEILAAADRQLYLAKENGRDRCEVAPLTGE